MGTMEQKNPKSWGRLWVLLLLGLVLALASIPGCDCGAPPGNELPTGCAEECFAWEWCNPATWLCENRPEDASDAVGDSDVGGDATFDSDLGDAPIDGGDPCTGDGDCNASEYCSDFGFCEYGCRVDPDNCIECTIWPDDCLLEEVYCSETYRRCATGCSSDDECQVDQYCALDGQSGTCVEGCRTDPDNCPSIEGYDVYCDASRDPRACVHSGDCTSDELCHEMFYCDNYDCIMGCRTDPDNCGSGQYCQDETHECVPISCDCEESEADWVCDERCNDAGSATYYYCDRDSQSCRYGCRVFEDGSHNCPFAEICDVATHTCIPGCETDDDCPFRRWCDLSLENPECVPGCNPGECDKDEYCDMEPTSASYHQCIGLPCDDDTGCPEGTYCNVDGMCVDGCRIAPDSCPEGLECDPVTRVCGSAECDEDIDCPLEEYCHNRTCILGCNGDDARCPPFRPCHDSGICACFGDDDCDDGFHCSTPLCEPDCTPDNPLTPEDEESCVGDFYCDADSGRCLGGCDDDTELASRNDTPNTAFCVLLSEEQKRDPTATALCAVAPVTLLDEYCDEEEYTFCLSGMACTGGDYDWYSMYLQAGDLITFGIEYPLASERDLMIELTNSDDPTDIIRAGYPTDDGNLYEEWEILETNQYFLRVWSGESVAVPYDMEVIVEPLFICEDDSYEPNGSPDLETVPLIPNSDVTASYEATICEGDRDFYGIELFSGNTVQFNVIPSQESQYLELKVGQVEGDPDDIAITFSGTLDSTTEHPNDVMIDQSVFITGLYYARVEGLSYGVETPYSMAVTTEQGTGSCHSWDDPYEDNDDPDATVPIDSQLSIPAEATLPFGQTFGGARLCPANGEPADLDYYVVNIAPGAPGGILIASLDQGDTNGLRVRILGTDHVTEVGQLGDPTVEVYTTDNIVNGTWVVVEKNPAADPLAWTGVSYNLTLTYDASYCDNDEWDFSGRNEEPDDASWISRGSLIGGTACNTLAFTTACTADPSKCTCQSVPSLTSCPNEEDWYRITLLAGDSFSVLLTPTEGGVVANHNVTLTVFEADCTEDTCLSAEFGGPFDTNSLLVDDISVRPPIGGVLANYYVHVWNYSATTMDYQLTFEVVAEHSRDCEADPWDAEIFEAPGDNEESCGDEAASCTITMDTGNHTRTGNICYWDQQDWFRFEVLSGDSRALYLSFAIEDGEIAAELNREVGDALVPVEPEDALSSRTEPVNRGDPYNGLDRAFYGMDAGTYQLRVHMPGPYSSLPNEYTIYMRWPCSGADRQWENGEACDENQVGIPITTQCGAGITTCVDCVCGD